MNHSIKHIFILLLLALPYWGFAQNDSTKKPLGIVPKVDMFLPVLGLLNNGTYLGISLEKEIEGHYSVQLSFQYFYTNKAYASFNNYTFKIDELQITPELRYYFSRELNYAGLYGGVYSNLLFINSALNYNDTYPTSISPPKINSNQTTLAIGLNVGYSIYIFKNLLLDLHISHRFTVSTPSLPNSLYDPGLRLSFDVGYRF